MPTRRSHSARHDRWHLWVGQLEGVCTATCKKLTIKSLASYTYPSLHQACRRYASYLEYSGYQSFTCLCKHPSSIRKQLSWRWPSIGMTLQRSPYHLEPRCQTWLAESSGADSQLPTKNTQSQSTQLRGTRPRGVPRIKFPRSQSARLRGARSCGIATR